MEEAAVDRDVSILANSYIQVLLGCFTGVFWGWLGGVLAVLGIPIRGSCVGLCSVLALRGRCEMSM